MPGPVFGAAKRLARALRLPFLSASLLPYAFGAILGHQDLRPALGGQANGPGLRFRVLHFLLGLCAVGGAHLAANLLNDYADSKSGVDWQDCRHYGFFGGSKLIQEGALSPRFYLAAAMGLAAAASLSAVVLALSLMRSPPVLIGFGVALLLAVSYSAKPLQLSYRRLGECTVFLLFGPAAVAAGYLAQTDATVFCAPGTLLLSLPFGFMTASILLANEVPDMADDVAGGKFTLISAVGQKRGYLLYAGAVIGALLSVMTSLAAGYAGPAALLALAGAVPAAGAAAILKRHYADKERLTRSSKLAILAQAVVGVALILDVSIG